VQIDTSLKSSKGDHSRRFSDRCSFFFASNHRNWFTVTSQLA